MKPSKAGVSATTGGYKPAPSAVAAPLRPSNLRAAAAPAPAPLSPSNLRAAAAAAATPAPAAAAAAAAAPAPLSPSNLRARPPPALREVPIGRTPTPRVYHHPPPMVYGLCNLPYNGGRFFMTNKERFNAKTWRDNKKTPKRHTAGGSRKRTQRRKRKRRA